MFIVVDPVTTFLQMQNTERISYTDFFTLFIKKTLFLKKFYIIYKEKF